MKSTVVPSMLLATRRFNVAITRATRSHCQKGSGEQNTDRRRLAISLSPAPQQSLRLLRSRQTPVLRLTAIASFSLFFRLAACYLTMASREVCLSALVLMILAFASTSATEEDSFEAPVAELVCYPYLTSGLGEECLAENAAATAPDGSASFIVTSTWSCLPSVAELQASAATYLPSDVLQADELRGGRLQTV